VLPARRSMSDLEGGLTRSAPCWSKGRAIRTGAVRLHQVRGRQRIFAPMCAGVQSATRTRSTICRMGPLLLPSRDEPGPGSRWLPRPQKGVDPIRVLLSGARPAQQRLTRDQLSSLFVSAEFAQDGVEATSLSRGTVFDIVLIDVDSSLLDSIFVTSAIRTLERATPSRRPASVVAYTGIEPPPFESLLRFTGANDVLRKSTAAAGMGECLARWCPDKFNARIL
jgi:CheY-like chemotaxis protein